MQGQIIKIVSDLHIVNCNNKNYDCKCRGIFRKNNTIPLVGDRVIFDEEKKIIEKILPRNNEFKRPKVANIDQAFIITSLKTPDFSLNLLDKLITLMELHRVKPIICITKSDLVSSKYLNEVKQTLEYYRKLNYIVIFNTDLDDIKKLINNKTSVFTGQTGAGKSTLLNKFSPLFNQQVGDVSKALGRGRHTTRVVELFNIYGGKVLDTPGFSALDFYEYSPTEIKDTFKEFKNYPCPFKDCMHTNEKECMVKVAVSDNNIMKSRYENYLNFIERK